MLTAILTGQIVNSLIEEANVIFLQATTLSLYKQYQKALIAFIKAQEIYHQIWDYRQFRAKDNRWLIKVEQTTTRLLQQQSSEDEQASKQPPQEIAEQPIEQQQEEQLQQTTKQESPQYIESQQEFSYQQMIQEKQFQLLCSKLAILYSFMGNCAVNYSSCCLEPLHSKYKKMGVQYYRQSLIFFMEISGVNLSPAHPLAASHLRVLRSLSQITSFYTSVSYDTQLLRILATPQFQSAPHLLQTVAPQDMQIQATLNLARCYGYFVKHYKSKNRLYHLRTQLKTARIFVEVASCLRQVNEKDRALSILYKSVQVFMEHNSLADIDNAYRVIGQIWDSCVFGMPQCYLNFPTLVKSNKNKVQQSTNNSIESKEIMKKISQQANEFIKTNLKKVREILAHSQISDKSKEIIFNRYLESLNYDLKWIEGSI